MAALVANCTNRDQKVAYGRLRRAGKPLEVAIAAATRKLSTLASMVLNLDQV